VTDKTLIDLRNAIYDRVTAVSGYTYTTTRKTPLPTLSSKLLPALAVFILGGDGQPDGDANVGNIRLINDDTVALSIVRGMDDPATLEGNIEAELQVLKNALFTDPTFVHFNNDFFFEALMRTRRRWLFPQNGDEYYIELRFEMTFRTRETFDPVIADTYQKTILTTRPAGKDIHTPAIVTEIDLAQ
jgi:hypothetical protein